MVLMQINIFAYADSLNVLLLMNVMWLWPIYLMQPKFVFQIWGKETLACLVSHRWCRPELY